jgi:threonine/homoserine efflux transporter RhtA
MRRGSLAVAVLSILGGIAALAGAVTTDQIVSPLAALGVVLVLNAGVRLLMARRP